MVQDGTAPAAEPTSDSVNGPSELEPLAMDNYKFFNSHAEAARSSPELDTLRARLEHALKLATLTDRELAAQAAAKDVSKTYYVNFFAWRLWMQIRHQARGLTEVKTRLEDLREQAPGRFFKTDNVPQAFADNAARDRTLRQILLKLSYAEWRVGHRFYLSGSNGWEQDVKLRCEVERELGPDASDHAIDEVYYQRKVYRDGKLAAKKQKEQKANEKARQKNEERMRKERGERIAKKKEDPSFKTSVQKPIREMQEEEARDAAWPAVVRGLRKAGMAAVGYPILGGVMALHIVSWLLRGRRGRHEEAHYGDPLEEPKMPCVRCGKIEHHYLLLKEHSLACREKIVGLESGDKS